MKVKLKAKLKEHEIECNKIMIEVEFDSLAMIWQYGRNLYWKSAALIKRRSWWKSLVLMVKVTILRFEQKARSSSPIKATIQICKKNLRILKKNLCWKNIFWTHQSWRLHSYKILMNQYFCWLMESGEFLLFYIDCLQHSKYHL